MCSSPILSLVYLVVLPIINAATIPAPFFQPSLSMPENSQTYCVSGTQWPQWRGTIEQNNCHNALQSLIARVPIMRHMVFYSATAPPGPPPFPMFHAWKLPEHDSSGSCTILTRMLIDFPSNILPTNGRRTLNTRGLIPFDTSMWREIIANTQRTIADCVGAQSQGGWTRMGGMYNSIGVFVLPDSSIMRINWAVGDQMIRGMNGTAGLVGGKNSTETA